MLKLYLSKDSCWSVGKINFSKVAIPENKLWKSYFVWKSYSGKGGKSNILDQAVVVLLSIVASQSCAFCFLSGG
jgi:hypothetical protein